jgi:Domain of unknown function (DUF4157)
MGNVRKEIMTTFAPLQPRRTNTTLSARQSASVLRRSRGFELPKTAPTSEPGASPNQQLAARFSLVHIPIDRQKENRTGLPDTLKADIESLSGMSLDDVKVHYRSPKPAQIQALAYTQGTEIHVGPGQEEHLPHEAWHVVQQKQGRVRPTFQAKGMAINDDQELEREASEHGEQPAEGKRVHAGQTQTGEQSSSVAGGPIQMMRRRYTISTPAPIPRQAIRITPAPIPQRAIRVTPPAAIPQQATTVTPAPIPQQAIRVTPAPPPQQATTVTPGPVPLDTSISTGPTPQSAISLGEGLNEGEREFFANRPSLEQTEGELNRRMADKSNPLKYEIGAVYDADQLKVVRRGKARTSGEGQTLSENAQVEINEEDLNLANPNSRDQMVVTHNHPGGAPLSDGDVGLAVGRGIREIRATGRYGTFSLKRTGPNWKISQEDVQAAFGQGEKAWQEVCESKYGKFSKYRPKDEKTTQVGTTFAQDFFLAKHYASMLLANKSDGAIEYTHPDEKTLVAARLQLYEDRPAQGADKRIGFKTDYVPKRGRERGGSF